MACVTLKRSLDWDPNSATGSNYGPNQRPVKRRCSNILFSATPPKEASPFGEVSPKITSEEITSNIKEEIRRLHNRKQLQYGSSQPLTISPPSPTAILSPDCSSPNSAMVAGPSGMHSPKREQPLFTSRQVGMICERLVKERESQIRDEYDKVLVAKLAEQYDTFVKFTYEQIHKNFDKGSTPSYLS
ncbi:Akirin [Halotydeus destructor]|nr:Akirin [Halotydeus destructor]